MRDLGQQNFDNRKRPLGKKALRILVLLIIIVGVIFLVKSRLNIGGSSGSVILREAPRGLTPVSVGNQSNLTAGAVDLTSQSATFKDVRYGGEAKATATRSFGGGVYILSVDATLPDPKNTLYEVWLVGGGEVIPIDFMNGSKNTWSLELRSSDKYSKYNGIWITLERTKDNLPEEHILEGTF